MRQAVEVHQDRQREGENEKEKERRHCNTFGSDKRHLSKYIFTFATRHRLKVCRARIVNTRQSQRDLQHQQQQQQQLQQQIAISITCQRRRQATPERTFKPNERQKQKLFPLPLCKSVESGFRQAAKKFFWWRAVYTKYSIYLVFIRVTDETGTNCTIGSRTGVISGTPHTVMELRSKR